MITFLEPDEREPAPELLGELLGGGAYSLAEERGDDVVVVNVWGSWCAPCRAEADALQAVYEEVQDDGVQFLGINTRDTEEAALTFAADKGITYPSLVDDGALQAGFSRSLPVAAIPTTYVLDRSGRVAARVVDDITLRQPARARRAGARREPSGRNGSVTSGAVAVAVGENFQQTAANGALVAAIGVSLLAGLVSFFSPCVLPLVPAYLSYVTGMSGAELEAPRGGQRGRVVLGVLLFVLGFAAFFTSLGAFFGNIGYDLRYAEWIDPVAGVLVIIFGLAFLGVLPGLDRTLRVRTMPRIGLAGAPLLGLVFAVGWLPCVGPTLSAVLTLSVDSATAGRGALLTLVYGLGLGIPFLVVAVAYQRALGAFAWVRAHGQVVTRVGGAMLVLLGVLLLTGGWEWFTRQMLGWISGVSTVI